MGNDIVVSGLASSKLLACSLMIKEFCGGKAGWNDRAKFIQTVLQASVRIQSAAAPTFPNSLKEEEQVKFKLS